MLIGSRPRLELLSDNFTVKEIFFRADSLPVPVALYPLNGRYGTKDISPNKNPPGIPNGVHLGSGPHGDPQGSYQFSGISTSHIEIPKNGGLDISYSITVLLWVNRQNNEGPMFVYGRNGFRFWIVGSSVVVGVSSLAHHQLLQMSGTTLVSLTIIHLASQRSG